MTESLFRTGRGLSYSCESVFKREHQNITGALYQRILGIAWLKNLPIWII